MWDVLKGKENPLRHLGKLKWVRGKDYNAGDTQGIITSKTDRQTDQGGKRSYFRYRDGLLSGNSRRPLGKSDKDTHPSLFASPSFQQFPYFSRLIPTGNYRSPQ